MTRHYYYVAAHAHGGWIMYPEDRAWELQFTSREQALVAAEAEARHAHRMRGVGTGVRMVQADGSWQCLHEFGGPDSFISVNGPLLA